MTPSPSSGGQDLAALSERLKRDVEAYAGKSVMLVRVDSMSTLLSAMDAQRAVEHRICDGCGTSRSDVEIKAGGFIACCPERNMLTAKQWAERAETAEAQLSAATKRAEAAEGALKDTRALIAAGIENLRATARDVRETERDRLKYAIMASALEGLSEAIEAADRARGLTGEGAER